MRRALAGLFAAATLCVPGHAAASAEQPCSGLSIQCPSPVANQPHGYYHGLVALSDDSRLLERAASSGTQPGCGDCVWTVILDCPQNSATQGEQVSCRQAQHDPACRRNQLAYQVYLSDAKVQYEFEGIICLGGHNHIVAVGELARADVERYLKNVRPPDLQVRLDPGTPLSGLATLVAVSPPAGLQVTRFGGSGVTERIRLSPLHVVWAWGDGARSVTAGSAHTRHTYLAGGRMRLVASTTWGATYTISYQGQTFGPYAATGRLSRIQVRPVNVVTSTPVLVSH